MGRQRGADRRVTRAAWERCPEAWADYLATVAADPPSDAERAAARDPATVAGYFATVEPFLPLVSLLPRDDCPLALLRAALPPLRHLAAGDDPDDAAILDAATAHAAELLSKLHDKRLARMPA